MSEIFRVKSITEFHKILGINVPEHPLISIMDDQDVEDIMILDDTLFNIKYTTDLYSIIYKDKISGSMDYGRSTYDYQEGSLVFLGPGQVYASPSKNELKGNQGWTLMFHPDLIRKSPLGDKISSYTFFSYNVNEALHLSPKEEKFFFELILKIREEYTQNLDQHSHTLIITNLELLLNYCKRFYDRQFYTRTSVNKDFIAAFEFSLKNYFASDRLKEQGLPSTKYFGEKLNMSTKYLSDMLKKETGKSIKEHIDGFIIEKAKSILLNSDKKISEIAYEFGFEYPQSFTRLFKNKTGMSPIAYRNQN